MEIEPFPESTAEFHGTLEGSESSPEEDDIQGNSTGGSGTSTDANRQQSNDEQDDLQYFAKQENERVQLLKTLALKILFIVTVAVSVGVYHVTSKRQQEEFRSSFDGIAEKVKTSLQESLEQNLGAIASLGVSFTAQVSSGNSSWPFVTINDFQRRASIARGYSKAKFLELLPIVYEEDREAWVDYSRLNEDWIKDGRAYQDRYNLYPTNGSSSQDAFARDFDPEVADQIFRFDKQQGRVEVDGPGPFFPTWQTSPVFPAPQDMLNYDLADNARYGSYIDLAVNTSQIVIGGIDDPPKGGTNHPDPTTRFFSFLRSFDNKEWLDYKGDPMSSFYVPVFDSFEDDRTPAALLFGIFEWGSYFENILPNHHKAVHVVLKNSCHGAITFKVSGMGAWFKGRGVHADVNEYKGMKREVALGTSFVADETIVTATVNEDQCQYTLAVYPTEEIDDFYNDLYPVAISVIVASSFLFTAAMFLLYDRVVEKRQRRILATAKKSTALVSSIFPRTVRDQLMGSSIHAPPVRGNAAKLRTLMTSMRSSKSAKSEMGDLDSSFVDAGGPIADLFPECTVLFGDIAGFTAWSSTREPCHVFQLLETLYAAFDRAAAKRRVFKVETIGDCYVAVSGLPEPCSTHAVKMANFAQDCIRETKKVTRRLELSLGPDTAELCIRIGLHSGPITAGVLRGEKSRFQLFGDTVNTASRIECSGKGNQAHLSEQTANLIKAAGHANWVEQRDEMVQLKGKGELQTFWLVIHSKSSSSAPSSATSKSMLSMSNRSNTTSASFDAVDMKTHRYVEWNVDLLLRLIKHIVWSRQCRKPKQESSNATDGFQWKTTDRTCCPRDEVAEIVEVIDPHVFHQEGGDAVGFPITTTTTSEESVELDPKIVQQTHAFVVALSGRYHDNPFHNFGHASHVTMSVTKLLSRIVAVASDDMSRRPEDSRTDPTFMLQDDHTFGITSDPLTQFACIFSALIHDVDHQGVSNQTLIHQGDPLVARYDGKSLAEQNSVDMAWNMLLSPDYCDLRQALCTNATELSRFRQLVVNSVLATDIFDPDLKRLRNDRWERAFQPLPEQQPEQALSRSSRRRISLSESGRHEAAIDSLNRKATIVIEHLIQASDVSHTMQHWNVYQKWNRRLYQELYNEYVADRSKSDPSDGWYQGELAFFDLYIIPLAKKLQDCGVFGVCSDEYLQYAMSNRNEWEKQGQTIVADWKKKQATSTMIPTPPMATV